MTFSKNDKANHFLNNIYTNSKLGFDIKEIADILEMKPAILIALHDRNEKVRHAFNRGKIDAKIEVKEAIRKKIISGNFKFTKEIEDSIFNNSKPDNDTRVNVVDGLEKYKGKLAEIKAMFKKQ